MFIILLDGQVLKIEQEGIMIFPPDVVDTILFSSFMFYGRIFDIDELLTYRKKMDVNRALGLITNEEADDEIKVTDYMIEKISKNNYDFHNID